MVTTHGQHMTKCTTHHTPPLPPQYDPPLPTSIPPVACQGSFRTSARVAADAWMVPSGQVLSIRAAVFMVSPKRQKRGIRLPTMPLYTGLCVCMCVCAIVCIKAVDPGMERLQIVRRCVCVYLRMCVCTCKSMCIVSVTECVRKCVCV
jgi:hypothetical protein